MQGYLKQATAAQVRTIGPFVDDTDFKSLENGLTIANTDIILKKNGAASAAKNSGGATADGSGGMYHLTWDATDTATVGELFYSVKVAGALVVFGSYTVVEEAVYDAQYAASAPGYATGQSTVLADAFLDRDMATGTDSGSSTVRTVRQALRFLRNKWTLTGATLSVKKEDDSTESWAATVTTDAAAEPITASDPAS